MGEGALFLGHYTCDLRAGNLALPAAWKHSVPASGVLTRGFERNLLFFTASAFDELYRTIAALNLADPLARTLARLILGSAHPLRVETGGGLALPERLAAQAGLSRSAVVLGQGEYCEIWSAESWSEQQTMLDDTRENASRFASLALFTQPRHDIFQARQ